tara:strand:+ start:129 stop:518 length:390 start_codon:yes stop_codon:yes gene_type:complete
MIKYFLLFFICLVFTSCLQKNKNNSDSIDLTFLSTHKLNIKNGKTVFNKSCITCHLYGTGGATILNDKKTWENILETKTIQKIYTNVLYGYVGDKGPMPQKGACQECSETDLLDAIEYILSINRLSIRK